LNIIIGQLCIVATCFAPTSADHLVPDAADMKDTYGVKLRTVFAEAYRGEVALQALYVPSFVNEFAVGLRTTAASGGAEVFLLEPSSSIWETELLRLYESGEIGAVGRDGKPVPLEQNKAYQKLKKRSPADYRKIGVRVRTRPIPQALADRIRSVWFAMLRGVRRDEEEVDGAVLDGETYHISAVIDGRPVGGSVYSPDDSMPKTWRLAHLVDRISEYAQASVDLAALTKAIQEAEQVIRP
jgi:hypothetical protein